MATVRWWLQLPNPRCRSVAVFDRDFRAAYGVHDLGPRAAQV